ncbi:MAG: rod shape-determining protein MreC [Oscillospiraceae bacterium]|jgi:rod shape-determining protein MreC|nr:rod shape-determining protein MreC [Oscillospiraceae bacterium]
MRSILNRRNVAILAAALLIAAAVIFAAGSDGGPGIFTRGLRALANPSKRAVASVAKTYESIYGYMYDYEQVVAENERLKSELAELRQDYREYNEVSEENARLHALLGLTARHPDYAVDKATVIQWGASNWQSTFTISKGSSNSAVKRGDAVITETGVMLGRVSEVGSVSSVCVSVLDTTFTAAVGIGQFGAAGVVSGDFTLRAEGRLLLTDITGDTTVFSGDSVVTSGRGSVFPEGLMIGTVTGVVPAENGLGVYAVVTPSADLTSAMNVFIVTDFNPEL